MITNIYFGAVPLPALFELIDSVGLEPSIVEPELWSKNWGGSEIASEKQVEREIQKVVVDYFFSRVDAVSPSARSQMAIITSDSFDKFWELIHFPDCSRYEEYVIEDNGS